MVPLPLPVLLCVVNLSHKPFRISFVVHGHYCRSFYIYWRGRQMTTHMKLLVFVCMVVRRQSASKLMVEKLLRFCTLLPRTAFYCTFPIACLFPRWAIWRWKLMADVHDFVIPMPIKGLEWHFISQNWKYTAVWKCNPYRRQWNRM